MADLCLGCHQDVAVQVRDRAGLHGGLMAGTAARTCHGCHTEHRGSAAALTVLDAATFPHDLIGYSLQSHQRTPPGTALACADCHVQDLAHYDPAVCATCHSRLDAGFMQTHLATFGPQCRPCHDGVDRYGRAFDHNKLSFALAGKHAGVACARCHTNATTVEALQRTPTDCAACHQKDDAHQGRFGAACAGCHTPEDWKKASFDHSKSAFPLTGAHVNVTCEQCHKNNVFKGTPADCAACHAEPAFHAGTFGNQGNQCATCHTTAGWSPAQFNLAHNGFPINHGERQQAGSCKTCHPTTVKEYTCYGCHQHNPARIAAQHAEEGVSGAELANCLRCHQGGRGRERD